MKTTNGGGAWVSQDSGAGYWLFSVHFPIDAQTGFSVGSGGLILKTTNGGASWINQTSGTTHDLFCVDFPQNTQTGYVAEGGRGVLKTTNGGTTWIRSSSDTTLCPISIHFPQNEQTGYSVGNSGIIFKTTNSGTSWERQISGTSSGDFLSVYFPSNQTGYAVGWFILKTTDGGTWVEETTEDRGQRLGIRLLAIPNPFTSFARIPGHEAERFALYDIAGRRVGTYKGERIGMDLRPGVYFIRALDREAGLGRIVKIR
jgi:photosystem II stability/assembly factor-like uncharacterized protein